jgi:hypothetical protein
MPGEEFVVVFGETLTGAQLTAIFSGPGIAIGAIGLSATLYPEEWQQFVKEELPNAVNWCWNHPYQLLLLTHPLGQVSVYAWMGPSDRSANTLFNEIRCIPLPLNGCL